MRNADSGSLAGAERQRLVVIGNGMVGARFAEDRSRELNI